MKKFFTVTVPIIIGFLLASGAFAQAPQGMTYQAVIRDADDNLLKDHGVGMQISILQGSDTGTAVFVERHFPTTNTNGLATIEIGDGTLVSGSFAGIDWADGPYFIKSETDPEGGANYTITGISPLLSVPYALHAKTADEFAETDPVFVGSPAAGIEVADIDNWNESHSWGNHADEGYITEETDPSVPSGTQTGEMLYWNGSAWITVAAGTAGQVLTFSGGVPKWMDMYDVENPVTGKIWMDRNLGATQVATSSTDANSYGHLYQWGRGKDGHQLRTSGTTTTQSSSDTPGHGSFIIVQVDPYDWRSPQNDNLWQGVNGINNPCPGGYRLPTTPEWEAERLSWSSNDAAGAFASPLKLPLAGYRHFSNGSLIVVGSYGYYWSSTVNGIVSQSLFFYSSAAYIDNIYRAVGFSVRCLKD